MQGAVLSFQEALLLNKKVARALRQSMRRGRVANDQPGGNPTAAHMNLAATLRVLGKLQDALYHAQHAGAGCCSTLRTLYDGLLLT